MADDRGITKERLALIRDLWGDAFRISRWWIPGHDGIDLPAKVGTPIRAIADGRVSYARDARLDSKASKHWALYGGKVVNIDVDSRYTTQYAHLQDIFVTNGQYVKKGQIIGTVGATGGQPNKPTSNFGAANAHLHFGLWDHKSNMMVQPDKFLKAALGGGAATGAAIGAGGAGGVALGGWGDLIKFPTGHVLTTDDVDTIIAILDKNGYFDKPAGAIARDTTRRILLAHVGEKWNKTLQEKLQAELNAAAVSAGDPLGGIGDALGSIAAVIGKLADPANWVRILALFAGVALVGIGGMGVLRATGPSVSIPRPGRENLVPHTPD